MQISYDFLSMFCIQTKPGAANELALIRNGFRATFYDIVCLNIENWNENRFFIYSWGIVCFFVQFDSVSQRLFFYWQMSEVTQRNIILTIFFTRHMKRKIIGSDSVMRISKNNI